ncbi:MAG: DJ-1/PfpI family protein [Minwuiales bacterium]|nr:DJ-1/PfpI family protein [Minwuiales bacterium]
MAESAHSVVMICFDGVQLLDVAGPMDCFAAAYLPAAAGEAPYRLTLVSKDGGAVVTSSGIRLDTVPLSDIRAGEIDTLMVPGGPATRDVVDDAALVGWIARVAEGAGRVCSVCSGAYLLAAAGLLDGRRAVTHWYLCDDLKARYPQVDVEPDAIFVRDGRIWTSAGVTAGIDLALAIVEADLGRRIAMEIARHLVVYFKRPGGQSQFSALLASQSAAADGRFDELQRWLAENLERDLGVDRLAERAGMSPRNFARLYKQEVGTTPARFVESLRLEAARQALEETAKSLGWIARRFGFGNEERMRKSFQRRFGVAPSRYRERFAA